MNANWRLFLFTGSLSLGYGSIFTLLPEIRDQFGFAESELGIIAGVGFLAGFASQVGLAWLADRGHASMMVRVGLSVAALSMVGMTVADELWQFIGARLVLGLGTGAVAPAIRRIIITRDPDNMGENLGQMMAFDIGGFVLGPLMSGILAEVGGLRLPFGALAFVYLALIPVALSLDLTTEADGRSPSEEERVVEAGRRWEGGRSLLAALSAAVAFYVTIGVFEAVWSLLLRDLGADQWFVGVSLSVFTLPMVFLAPVGGRLAQRLGPLRVATVSIAVATVCTLSYGFVGNPRSSVADIDEKAQFVAIAILVTISLVHAVADSFTMPSNQVAVAISSPPGQIAARQGIFGATGLVVAGIAAPTMGWVYEHHGAEMVFSATAAVMVVFLVLSVALGKDLRSPKSGVLSGAETR